MKISFNFCLIAGRGEEEGGEGGGGGQDGPFIHVALLRQAVCVSKDFYEASMETSNADKSMLGCGE